MPNYQQLKQGPRAETVPPALIADSFFSLEGISDLFPAVAIKCLPAARGIASYKEASVKNQRPLAR